MTVKPKSGKAQQTLLASLRDGLSEEELGQVMANSLLVMDGPTIDKLVRRLAPETGVTLRSLLAEIHNSQPFQVPSSRVGTAKVKQEWKRAWREWSDCVDESGREKGKYIYQDNQWDEPSLDTGTLSDDLDSIAGRLRPLVTRVIVDGLNPEFSLSDAMCQTADSIGAGLPDYIDPQFAGGLSYGREATTMLLQWECAQSRKEAKPLLETLHRIADLKVHDEHLSLDHQAIVAFIRGLSRADKNGVIGDLRSHRSREPWKSALKKGWGTWFNVFKTLGLGKIEVKRREKSRVKHG